MRELIFKNLTSGDKKRKDLFISETVERKGVKTTTQRHSMYIVNSCNKFATQKELLEWQNKTCQDQNKRHIFIFKKRDSKTKKDSFVCDVVGKFYAVVENDVYSVAFKHSLEIEFINAKKNI